MAGIPDSDLVVFQRVDRMSRRLFGGDECVVDRTLFRVYERSRSDVTLPAVRILTRSIVTMLLLSASLLAQSQTLAGQWQGVLQVGKDLRIVLVITTADGLKATMYSIDQTPQGIPANPITLQGTTLRMSFGGIGARFEGTVSADGNSVTG